MKAAILGTALIFLTGAAFADVPGGFGISPSDSGEALRYLRCGKATLDFEARIVACKQLVRDKGADSYAGSMLGKIYLEQGDMEKAHAVYDQMVANSGRDPWAWAQRGAFFVAAGDPNSAMKDAEAAFAAAPQTPAAFTARCFVRAIANRELEAGLADCDAAFAKAPVDADMLSTKGLILYRMGRFSDAVDALTSAIRKDFDRVDAWSRYLRGLAKRAQGNSANGDSDIDAAALIDPHISDLLDRYGVKAP
ncbi:MAG: hypothetical protein ISS15_09410 [Alphaproteobacteria bacterium]|nr:hypothetical protein [Alphaproteobacteria bacterium]MBL6938780.1 hypothetical protein [Alphaproteobacteria bacterium]MBL7097863.1 hypothetical protein [Alphaproteobacteria bacterium]